MKPLRQYAQEMGLRGVVVTGLGCVLLAFLLAAYMANPVKETEHHVVNPVARDVGILGSTCPDGWDDTSSRDVDTRIDSCQRDGWVVILNADGSFQHAIHLDTPGSDVVNEPSEVPGWPR